MIHRAFVGVGANLGDCIATVERALSELSSLGRLARRSRLYRTQPWGKLDQPAFVNAAALVETEMAPAELLTALKAIEEKLGRVAGERWGPRAIDLDLLAYDDLTLDTPALRLPHPHLHERAFVLVPLAEIEPRYVPVRDALEPSELAGVAPV